MMRNYYSILVALSALAFLALVIVLGVTSEGPDREQLRNYFSMDEYYGYDVCEYIYESEADIEYCQREELGTERTELKYDCDALTSSELREDCHWDAAIVSGNADLCDKVSGSWRDICLWDVFAAEVWRNGPPDQNDPDAFRLCEMIVAPEVKDNCFNRTRRFGPDPG
jgi:hypothetical protein